MTGESTTTPRRILERSWERVRDAFTLRPFYGLVLFVNPEGTKWTPRRLFNYHLARREFARGRTRLRSYPLKLTVESTSVCNLRCPACFTGIGEAGRRRGAVPPEFFTALMDVLGSYLLEVEFTNWGEPLLNQHLEDMVEVAARSGTTTTFSTNFSFPFTPQRAERLVRSGLTSLGVSIDGARQETYEQYRVGGDLALVLRNCELVQDAKRRLGSRRPPPSAPAPPAWAGVSPLSPQPGRRPRPRRRGRGGGGGPPRPQRGGDRGPRGPGSSLSPGRGGRRAGARWGPGRGSTRGGAS